MGIYARDEQSKNPTHSKSLMLLGIFSLHTASSVVLTKASEMRFGSMLRRKGCDAGKRGHVWKRTEPCRDQWKDGRIGGWLRCCFIYTAVFTVSLVS